MQNQKRKYYFMDYTQRVELSKKIKNYLFKNRAIQDEFHYKELGKYLKTNLYNQPMTRKDKDGNITYFQNSLVKEDLLFQMQKSFDLLQDLGYLESYDFEHLPKQDSYLIHVVFTDEKREFDELLKESIYYPVKGEKQKLTDELRNLIGNDYIVDYQKIIHHSPISDYKELADYLQDVLSEEWILKYQEMTKVKIYINEITIGFTFLFDSQYNSIEEDFVEDRVVVAYGFSNKVEVKRDSSRMAGYLKGAAWDWTDKDTDKGHFIGHSLGGNLDQNLFPQKKDINRGLSERGKVYRKMEQYCADNEGTFCFSRPIYCDFSTRPFVLEYGVLKQDGTFWVELFDNV